MMGWTHFKVGVTTCAIAATVPALSGLSLISNKFINISMPGEITLAGLVTAGIAAYLTDADSQHSKINQMNPATGLINEGIEKTEAIIKDLVKFLITFSLAYLLFRYSPNLISELAAIVSNSTKATIPALARVSNARIAASFIIYSLAALLVISGVTNESFIKGIPVIGDAYKSIISGIEAASSLLKRLAMIVVYAGTGIWVMLYNYQYNNEFGMYVVGFLAIAIAIFPHRSFMHSVLEGLPIVTFSAAYVLTKLGYPSLTGAFFIGYASHILLTDIFTKEGVPLSVLPKVLEKTGLHGKLNKYKIYELLHAILSVRLRIPLMSTGTKMGNKLEFIYSTAMFFIAVAVYAVYGGVIRII